MPFPGWVFWSGKSGARRLAAKVLSVLLASPLAWIYFRHSEDFEPMETPLR